MKTIKLFFILMLSVAFLNSCKDDDPTGDGGGTNALTITSNKTTYDFDEYAFFTVKTGSGTEVSSLAEVKMNDEVVNYQHQMTTAGTFTVIATYDGVTSNEISVTVNAAPVVTSLEVTAEQNLVLVGEDLIFHTTATYDNGSTVDKTMDSDYFSNNTSIASNVYNTGVGNYTIKATYDGITSNEISVEVEALGPRFQKHAVIEDYTGTWCGWCPRVAYGIEQVEATTTFAIPVAAHIGDAMQNATSVALKNEFGVTGYPTAKLDRYVDWTYPEPSNVAQVVDLTTDPSRVGVSLNASLSGTSIDLTVNAKFGENYSENVFLTVLVLEDDLFADQDNYTNYYGGVSVLTNFEHDHVLRAALTNVTGDQIPTDQTTKNNVYVKSYSVNVPATISNSAKMSFVAIVSTADKKVINARSVHINASNNFEQN
ncbi:MAG: Omp28-related outer membrane protein [Flavobacteriaceae bacterium]